MSEIIVVGNQSRQEGESSLEATQRTIEEDLSLPSNGYKLTTHKMLAIDS